LLLFTCLIVPVHITILNKTGLTESSFVARCWQSVDGFQDTEKNKGCLLPE